MLPKEDREIISKIGRYQYFKMKELNMTYDEFLKYQDIKKREKILKQKIGHKNYNKMMQLGMNYQEYKQYQKEQKLKKYEKKREKDKIRFKTIRYIERYCELEMKCQECKTNKEIEIHHPNYKDYLKVNILCRKHHTQLHNFELIPPSIIDLEKIAIKKPPAKAKAEYIKSQLGEIKQDILNNNFAYTDIEEKYNITRTALRTYLSKEQDYETLKEILKENGKRNQITRGILNSNNLIRQYQINNNMTAEEISKITNIPAPTIRKLSSGQTDINKIKFKTKQKLIDAKIL